MDDFELLQQYAATGSSEAFAELARRHINWIWSAARRAVADAHMAEDVVQTVFMILSRKAGAIRGSGALTPWLFKVTRYAASQARRGNARRRFHERKAAAMNVEIDQSEMTSDQWSELGPMLDELVGRLSDADRRAVLLRFYQGKSFAEVGREIDATEEAARKRVNRAVEKLRSLFARRGTAVPVGVLASGLLAHTTQSAPASLLPALAGNAPAALVKGTLHMMMLMKLKVAAMFAIAIVGTLLAGIAVTQTLLAQTAPPAAPARESPAQGANPQNVQDPDALLIKVVDAAGKPRSGVIVASSYGESYSQANGQIINWTIAKKSRRGAMTDPDGTILAPWKDLFPDASDRYGERRKVVYALDRNSGMVAMKAVDFADPQRQLTLNLGPACRLTGRVNVAAFERSHNQFKHVVFLGAENVQTFLTQDAIDGRFEFLVPPGAYRLRISGNGKGVGPDQNAFGSFVLYGGIPLLEVSRNVTVAEGQRELDLGTIELEPTPMGKLVWQPAPELFNIKEWKNTPPLTLQQLRGKHVILFFCSRGFTSELGRLAAMCGKYKENGLVLIAIHDGEAATMEQAEQSLAGYSRPPKPTDIPLGLDIAGPESVTETYHRLTFPTSVLISPDGVLVHCFPGGRVPEDLIRDVLKLPPVQN